MSDYKPVVTITFEQFEKLYVSRAAFDEMKACAEKAEALLDVALGAITSVVACCTYGTEEQAKSGAYGISRDAFVKIDKFMRMYSEAVKGDE